MERYARVMESTLTSVEDGSYKQLTTRVDSDILFSVEVDPTRSVLTPFSIPAHAQDGKDVSRQEVCFVIINKKDPVESVSIRIMKGGVVYASVGEVPDLRSDGRHQWSWSGLDDRGVLSTKDLKAGLTLELTAKRVGVSRTFYLQFKASYSVVDWVDLTADTNASIIKVEVRPRYSNGGVSDRNPSVPVVGYQQLLDWAQQGISHYWSRDGSRANGVAAPIALQGKDYKVIVDAKVNQAPSAPSFRLIEDQNEDFGRSTSLAVVRKVVLSSGFYFNAYATKAHRSVGWAMSQAEGNFKETAAHEFGHLILNAYEGDPWVPTRSWSHKGTSTVLTQEPLDNHPSPVSGEIDVMHYFSGYTTSADEMRSRTAAAEDDVKGLIWIARLRFSAA